MKRMIVAIVAIAMLAAACSDSDEGFDTTTPTPETTTSTVADTTTTSAGGGTSPLVPGEDPDADAIAEMYAVVFDSATTYDEKAPFIDDPAGLEATVNQYIAAGDSVGGIFLEVTAVDVEADGASVVYDLLFAGSPFQTDQPGDAVRNLGKWQVTREFFCSIMGLARVSCP